MPTLKFTVLALLALSLTAVPTFAGPSTSQITDKLSAEKATCSSKQFGKRFYDRETDTFTRHCSK